MSKDNSRLIKTICISGSSAVISYLINFFLTSFISENVGIEAYSFVSIAKTAVSYAQIITVALTTFIVRYISINYHQKQMEKARAYYSSSIVACVLLSGGIYLVILALLPRLEYIINIPDNLIYPVKILFLLVFFNFILTTLITPLNSGAFIKNRLDISGILKIISYLTDAGVLILVFSIATPSIWVVGLGSVTASLVLATGTFIMKQKLVPQLKSIRCVKDMMSNGIWQSVNSLGNVLNSGLDLIVSNLMLSGTETGQIAVVKTIGTMFSMLYQVVNQPFQLLRRILRPQLLNQTDYTARQNHGENDDSSGGVSGKIRGKHNIGCQGNHPKHKKNNMKRVDKGTTQAAQHGILLPFCKAVFAVSPAHAIHLFGKQSLRGSPNLFINFRYFTISVFFDTTINQGCF